MNLAYSLLIACVLTIVFIEATRILSLLETAQRLLGVTKKASWVMRHRYSPDSRKERLIQRYSLQTLLQTLQLALRLTLVLACCLLAVRLTTWLLGLEDWLDRLVAPEVLLLSLVLAFVYLPLRRRLRGDIAK